MKSRVGFICAILLTAIIVSSSLHLPFIKDDAITISKSIFFIFLVGIVLVLYSLTPKLKISVYNITRLDQLTAVFLLYSVINNGYHSSSFVGRNTIELIGLIVFYFFSKRTYLQMQNRQITLVFCFLFLTALHLSVVIFQWNEIMPSFNSNFKFSGLFNNPGPFAIYLGILSAACAVIYCVEDRAATRHIAVFLFLVAGFILFVAGSRASWLGLIVALTFIFATRLRCGLVLKGKIARPLVFGLLIISVISFSRYLYNLKKDSADGRILVWKICLGMICDTPVTGVGAENFPAALLKYQAAYFADLPNRVEKEGRLAGESSFAFNDLLQITAEQGGIGLILFGIVLVKAGSTLQKLVNESHFKVNTHLQVATTTLIVILVGGLFSYPMTLLTFQVLFFYSISVISAETELATKPNTVTVCPVPTWRFAISTASLICGLVFILFSVKTFAGYRAWKLAEDSSSIKARTEFLRTDYFCLRQDSWLSLFKARYLYTEGKYDESIEILQSSSVRCARASVYYTLGASYESIGRFDKAIETYTFLRNALPDLIRPRYLLAKVYHQTGETDKFIAAAEELVHHNPKVRSRFTAIMKQEILDLRNE